MFETLIASLLGGPLTGILGGAVQLWFKHLANKSELEKVKVEGAARVAIIGAESAASLAEWSAKRGIAEVETKGATDVADAKVLSESHKADAISLIDNVKAPTDGFFSRFVTGFVYFIFGLVEFLKKLIRPSLVGYLAFMTTILWIDARNHWVTFGLAMQQKLAGDVYVQIVGTILYLFTTAVAWYFVTRHGITAPPIRINK